MLFLLALFNWFSLAQAQDFSETLALEIQRRSVRIVVSANGGSATAVALGAENFLINRHALEELGGCPQARIELYTPENMQFASICKKQLYCSTSHDFCVIQVESFEKESAIDIRSYHSAAQLTEGVRHKERIFKIGRTIQSDTNWIKKWGRLFYCIETTKGDSGSALFSENRWVGMHTERIAIHLGCSSPKTSSGIPSEIILEEIRQQVPQLQ